MTLLPVLSLAQVASAPPGKAPPPVVPVEWRAMPLGKLLPLVGEKIGRKLEATRAVADLPLLVRIEPGEKPDVVLGAIAECVYGSWSLGSDGVLRLVRDQARWNRAIEEDKAAVRKGWEIAIARKRKKVGEMTAPDWKALARDADAMISGYQRGQENKIWEKASALTARSPIGRLNGRLAAAMTASDLAELGPLGVVYADRPTASQRPLPPGIMAAVATWRNEASGWHDVGGKLGLDKRAEQKQFWYGSGFTRTQDAPAAVGRVILRVAPSRWSEEHVDLRLRIYDDAGKLAHTAHESLSCAIGITAEMDWENPATRKAWEEKFKKLAEEAKASPEYSYSPEAIAHQGYVGYEEQTIDPKWWPLVMNPVRFDPHAGAASERSTAYAQWKKRSLVEWFDDGFGIWHDRKPFRAGDAGPFPLRIINETESVGPIIARPFRPVIALARQADRALLGTLLRLMGGGPKPSLDVRADVAHAVADESQQSILRQWPDAVRRKTLQAEGTGGWYDFGEDDWLSIYGGLPYNRRGNGTIPLSSLSEKVRRLCLRKVYGVDAQNPGSRSAEENFAQEERYEGEPTVRWARGVPDGTLKITRTEEEIVSTKAVRIQRGEVTHAYGGYPMDASSYASMADYRASHPQGDEDGPDPTDWTRLRYGKKTQVKLELRFPDGVGYVGELNDTAYPTKDYVPFASLPKSFREAVEAARAARKKNGG